MKQKDIKKLVNSGMAEDISAINNSGKVEELMKNGYTIVGISSGAYGMNGGLFRDNVTGKLYAIVRRSTNLFALI